MIQLNLLPDVKLEYIKIQRQQRLVITTSILVSVAAIIMLILVFGVDLAEKKRLSDLNSSISSQTRELQSKPDISKILTVQNQLESLTKLHSAKPAVIRLFTDYPNPNSPGILDQITPSVVSIGSLHVDFTTQHATVTGAADSLASINEFVDTLKFTTYTTDKNKTAAHAFSSVVLSSFSLNSGSADPNQRANYTIDMGYDQPIFDITQKVKLTVPNIITTRSEVDQPGDLFKKTTTPTGPAGTATTTTTTTGGTH